MRNTDRQYILPSVLAWTAGILMLVILIFDVPVLRMPRSLGVVQNIGALEPEVSEEDEIESDFIPDTEDGGNVIVRYVAMGEERSSILKNAPRHLKEGDTVTVAYSEEDPYDIVFVRVGRYFIHGILFAGSLLGFLVMWYTSAHDDAE